MPQNFLACDRDQSYLMPPSLRDWLAEDELAWCVVDAVAEMDLSVIYDAYRADGHGRAAFDPAMMVALLLYCYAIGERSSRAIERRCHLDVAVRVITANQQPDHATIARFRARHEEALSGLFGQVLGLCAKAGLVSLGVIALDGTKINANASGLANRTYEQISKEMLKQAGEIDAQEDRLFGDARGDELPEELANTRSRRARLRAAKEEMEAEQQALVEAHERRVAEKAREAERRGGKPLGRPLKAPSAEIDPDRRANITDADSRVVKTARGFVQGYNAQAVTTCAQIIIAADVLIGGNDQGQLEPMIRAAQAELGRAGVEEQIDVALADAGYWKSEQIQNLWADGIRALVPPDGQADDKPNGAKGDPRRCGGIYDHMRRVLAGEHGRALYKHRGQTIEPIFGQTKHNRHAERFQRRGITACRSEWRLIAATHNLLKLWKAAPALHAT
jgi:transposase